MSRRRIAVPAAVVLAATAGCSTAPVVSTLIPTTVGATWTYQAADTVDGTAPSGTIVPVSDSTIIASVSADTTIGGSTFVRFGNATAMFGLPGNNPYWQNGSDGFAFLQTATSPPLLFLPYPTPSGFRFLAYGYVQMTGNVQVKVPAGTFSCISYESYANTIPGTRAYRIIYVAPRIGVIKHVEAASYADGTNTTVHLTRQYELTATSIAH